MEIATITEDANGQCVRLPKGFHFEGDKVSVRHEGEAIILEPLRAAAWPEGFFDSIHITDPAFGRPDQGELPPPKLI